MIRLKVNSNGNTAEELIRVRVEAAKAMQAAIKAFRETAPHGRDYQTCCDKSAYQMDRHDFETRLGHLNFFSEQLMSDAILIQEQQR